MVALHMLRSSGVKSSRPAVVRGWVTALLKASGPAELHILHRSGVKSSRPAVGVGWVTTGVSRLASVWRGLGGGLGPRLGVKESRRRLAPHRPVWGLLAGDCPWEASPPLMAEAWSPVQIQLSCCPWEASPPDGGCLVPGADPSRGVASCWRGPARGMSRLLMADAWSPVQIHLAGSPPVGGGLPVGCLASCWRRPVPGAGLAATKYLLERQLWYSVLI